MGQQTEWYHSTVCQTRPMITRSSFEHRAGGRGVVGYGLCGRSTEGRLGGCRVFLVYRSGAAEVRNLSDRCLDLDLINRLASALFLCISISPLPQYHDHALLRTINGFSPSLEIICDHACHRDRAKECNKQRVHILCSLRHECCIYIAEISHSHGHNGNYISSGPQCRSNKAVQNRDGVCTVAHNRVHQK